VRPSLADVIAASPSDQRVSPRRSRSFHENSSTNERENPLSFHRGWNSMLLTIPYAPRSLWLSCCPIPPCHHTAEPKIYQMNPCRPSACISTQRSIDSQRDQTDAGWEGLLNDSAATQEDKLAKKAESAYWDTLSSGHRHWHSSRAAVSPRSLQPDENVIDQ
jgi:hypothetical protein